LVYYVTDYITKSSLPTHVGLAALSYAIEKNKQSVSDMRDGDFTRKSRGSLTIAVNSMMARQKYHISKNEYLLGGGDHYTSENFQIHTGVR